MTLDIQKYFKHASDQICDGINDSWDDLCNQYQITDNRIKSHLFAQMAHESAWFSTTKEFGPNSYFNKYNNRADLGNTQPGDGPRFKGRGLIQITGRANYTALMNATGVDCVEEPELLEQFPLALEVCFWFWSIHPKLSYYASVNNLIGVTKIINGGTNGLIDRRKCLDLSRELFNVDLI